MKITAKTRRADGWRYLYADGVQIGMAKGYCCGVDFFHNERPWKPFIINGVRVSDYKLIKEVRKIHEEIISSQRDAPA